MAHYSLCLQYVYKLWALALLLLHIDDSSRGVWSLGVHDNHYGNVSCISLTYDDQYLLTGAGDGNVFIYETNLPANSPTSAPVKVSIVCVNFAVPFYVK